MRSEVQWEKMFPDELDDALTRYPVVYLTYGLCEPHGLYNAVGLDALKAHGLACRAAVAHGGIVAPPFYWHVHEIGIEARWAHDAIGDRNPWLTSVPPWVLYKMFLYQLRAAAARGFRAAIVLSGHYPYEQDFRLVSDVFMRHSPMHIWAGSDADATDNPRTDGGHAGRYETSVFWALYPQLVDTSRLERNRRGVALSMAASATAEESSPALGEGYIEERVRWLGRKARELLELYREPDAPAGPIAGNPLGALTFDDTERIWRAEIRPRLHEFVSFKDPDEQVDPNSPWASNESCSLYD